MTTPTLPTNPMSLRREYLNTSRKVATMQANETDVAYLITLTEALLRQITQTPTLHLVLAFKGSDE